MSRLPFLWPSISILLILFITFSISNIFFSLPIPHAAEHKPASPHEHTHAEDAHPHDHEDTHMDTPSIRLPPQPPIVFPPSAEAVHAAIASSSGVLEQLSALAPADATVENVLLPLAASEAALTALVNTLTILSLASTDDTTEVLELLAELNEHNLRTSTHPSLSPLLTALHNSNNTTDAETARYLHALYTGLLHTGAALTAEEQLRLEVLQESLSNLSSTFQHNLITCNSTLSTASLNLTGVSPASLPLPPSDTLLLTPRTIAAVLTAAEDPATRHTVWAAGENSVPENVPVFAEMIRARREAAGLLGYGSWAAMRLAGGRMAPDAEFVRGFLAEARARIAPVGVREVAELERALGGEYHLWDKRYAERLRERSEGAGMAFDIEGVLPRVLAELGGVFGLQFVAVGREEWAVMRGVVRREGEESAWDGVRDGEDAARGEMAWHPDVKLFAVWNAASAKNTARHEDSASPAHPAAASSSSFVGYLYLDLLARPSKTAQAGSLNITPGHHHPSHPRHYPSTAVLTTFPATGKLSHTELIVLFHELGHAIHDLVSTTQFARHHGPAGVAVDFAEVPSRVGEELAWDAGVLVRLGAQESHARAVVDGRWEGAALAALRGVHIAAFDMMVHGEDPPQEEGLVGVVYNELRREVIPVKGGEPGERLEGYATFGHLTQGYDAGYYGYLVSSCYAADVWGVFSGGEEWGVVGGRWRGVLEAGGSRAAGELVEEFLGTRPGCGVFYRRLGVADAEGEKP
ncbi:uncharacterized protein H6S33_008177 [Morchella sextelata]|uniref:uncharacterized protein n=1 Tax=Morchella sextelata TaxID=1174677 RepID=UPI001D037D2F|nr:uncharacterized protein H6S33_008177 [Morchella sextelata]KAH0603173.1 hypothetical protein H6S33_008177 [Morchella sextelata]